MIGANIFGLVIIPLLIIIAFNPNQRQTLRNDGIKNIMIGDHVWIGAGAVILPGVTIGNNSVIGAASVVTKNIPANTLAVGNPCHVIKQLNAASNEQ